MSYSPRRRAVRTRGLTDMRDLAAFLVARVSGVAITGGGVTEGASVFGSGSIWSGLPLSMPPFELWANAS